MKIRQYITDIPKLNAEMSRFVAYVQYQNWKEYGNEDRLVSFGDKNSYLYDEEIFKSEAGYNAYKTLQFDKWKEDWIGTGKIATCASAAIDDADKLVNPYQKIKFKNKLDPEEKTYNPDAEKVLYDIYCGHDDEKAFSQAVDVFGGSYDLIAFLFFAKNDKCFLPISSGHFDKSFEKLGIDYSMSGKCSWGNYQGFVSIISEIQNELKSFLPIREVEDISLVDAHSFTWIIQQDRYNEWNPDRETEVTIEQTVESYTQRTIEGAGGRRKIVGEGFIRNQKVVEETKRRAHGICQLCNNPAPFKDKTGTEYLETHHVVWLSRGGKDSTDNAVALCPNCHTKMHVVDDPADVQFLKNAIAKLTN